MPERTQTCCGLSGVEAEISGVMTSFDCRLYPVGAVTAGDIYYPIREARTVLRFFRDVMAEVPDSFQAALNLSADDRGVFISLCHAGDGVEAGRLTSGLQTRGNAGKGYGEAPEFTEFAGIKPAPIKLRCVQGLCLQRVSTSRSTQRLDRLAQAPVGSVDRNRSLHARRGVSRSRRSDRISASRIRNGSHSDRAGLGQS